MLSVVLFYIGNMFKKTDIGLLHILISFSSIFPVLILNICELLFKPKIYFPQAVILIISSRKISLKD